MINYNSYIDSFSSRSQNQSPSYSALKKPIQLKPRGYNFHDSMQTQRPEDISPHILSIHSKPLSISPQRGSNMYQRLSDISRVRRNPSLSPISASLKQQSLAVGHPRVTIVYSKIKQNNLPSIPTPINIKQTSFIKDSSEVPSLILKLNEKAKQINKNTSIKHPKSGLFQSVLNFKNNIEKHYKKMYGEIDVAQKGYFTTDDFINLVMFVDLIKSNQKDDFDMVKEKADDVFEMFLMTSRTNVAGRKDFYAVCSVYEYVKGDGSLDLLDEDTREMIKQKIEGYYEVFLCYAKNGTMKIKDLHNILVCLQFNEMDLIENMLHLEVIDFSCFLRHLPLFSWIHENVIKSLDFNN